MGVSGVGILGYEGRLPECAAGGRAYEIGWV